MAVERLNHLIDDVGNNEQYPLYELLDTFGTMIHAYEEKYHPVHESSGIEMLQFFMNEHGLLTSDLQEIGSPNTVSEILDGKRELTVKQIRALAERFHVSPAIFSYLIPSTIIFFNALFISKPASSNNCCGLIKISSIFPASLRI